MNSGGRGCGRRGRGSVGGGRNVMSDDDKKTKSGRGRGRGAKSKKLAEMHEEGLADVVADDCEDSDVTNGGPDVRALMADNQARAIFGKAE
ncbi:hypothetical protein CEUSTIGMA_g1525.t1 [Chlamydomonas eustigma]|uniref:Uncharacterized protein n=1 Tax=Chlamydomonas eustigma TaxID=1157962 RepID=A0A250WTE6_9CHLO|nr:hypothetical protein CEUSTIGMA_g1525.t1 [Chlamydomonas eustigma]|eukprot:GAX74075.1 hypothetical protein CEUSTIGMA_g1525.t1 [Chlamydomonas eustigma]